MDRTFYSTIIPSSVEININKNKNWGKREEMTKPWFSYAHIPSIIGMKEDGGNLRKGEMLKNVRASVSRLLEAKHCVYPRLLSGGGTGSRVATVQRGKRASLPQK